MFSEDKKWEADAGNISNYDTFDKFVYQNGAVKAFLNDTGKYFIIAAKGLGKTLLLSYKRYLLEKKYSGQGIIFIPTQHPYVSFIKNIGSTLSNEHISKLESWEYCKKMWIVTIELSVLSYLSIDIDTFIESAPSRVQRHTSMLKNILTSPKSVEYVFNEIIHLSESTLTKFIDEISNPLSEEFLNIKTGVVMFFDRLDNALETAHDTIWQAIQTGLIEAAWDIIRSNHHVKIYLSIRQEAYAAHRSHNLNAISSDVVKIEYSREELKYLLNHLLMYYENKATLEDFLGFKTFPNTITYQEEDIFDFMFRYSIGRPRDFVQFCDALSKSKDTIFPNEQKKRLSLKETIRTTSSKTIIFSLFEELRMLLKCLTNIESFNRFLTCLSDNILTYSEMQSICCCFNRYNCMKDCKQCSTEHHPFCDLYNMGLLGIITENDNNEKVQHFRTPNENMINGLRSNSNYFLVHPALREYINDLHKSTDLSDSYNMFMGILIGEDVPWIDKYNDLCVINRWISQIKKTETHDFFHKTLQEYIKSEIFKFPQKQYEEILKKRHSIYEQRINASLVKFFTENQICYPKPLSIFVSYAFDNDAHKSRVESFVDMLRDMGFNANMDSSLKEEYPDIDQMMTVGLQMDKIIIVLSEAYKRKADHQEGGVWKEFKMIADDLENNPQKYIFVSFDKYSVELKEKISPKRIGNRWIVDLKKDAVYPYNELISFIKDEKEYPFKDVNESAVSVHPKEIKAFK